MPGAAGAGGDGRGASVSAPSGPGMHGMCLCHHQLIQRLSQNRMPAFCDVQFVQVTLNFPLYSTQSSLFCFLQIQMAPFNWRGQYFLTNCSIFLKYISLFFSLNFWRIIFLMIKTHRMWSWRPNVHWCRRSAPAICCSGAGPDNFMTASPNSAPKSPTIFYLVQSRSYLAQFVWSRNFVTQNPMSLCPPDIWGLTISCRRRRHQQ